MESNLCLTVCCAVFHVSSVVELLFKVWVGGFPLLSFDVYVLQWGFAVIWSDCDSMASFEDESFTFDGEESFEDFLRRTGMENSLDHPSISEPVASPVDSQLYPLDSDFSEGRDYFVDNQLGNVEPDNSTTEGVRVDTALHVRLALQSQTQEVPRPIWETGIWRLTILLALISRGHR